MPQLVHIRMRGLTLTQHYTGMLFPNLVDVLRVRNSTSYESA